MKMDDYFKLFESEALDNIQKISNALLELEKEPSKLELINEIYRAAHTIKGMAGTMGFDNISDLTHGIEGFMSKYRSGEREISSKSIDLLFEAISALEELINSLKTKKPEKDISKILERLKSQDTEVQRGKEEKEGKEEKGREEKEEGKEERRLPQIRKINVVKVNVEVLDTLINLVGELIISKNSLKELTKDERREIKEAIGDIEGLIASLQNEVFNVRLVPVEQIFNQFPRVVRELSREKNKKIKLMVEGEQTEMDRSMIDAISEPLVHLIRNSIDHGIETTQERRAKGKGEEGKIWLRAKKEGDFVIIEVEDDGVGINIDKVKRDGIEKELINENATRDEILDLIFMPGFSTSTEVTKVSGRGVGMDVVKNTVESFNGTVSVETEKDGGTKVSLKLPFTIIITKVFLVKAHENIYAVPLDSVKRIIDLRSANIKTIDREEVLLLADKTVPLLSLGEILFGNGADPRYGVLIEEETSGVVLGIDSVLGIEDIVARPLSRALKSTPYFSGSTLLGDGTAILIIDPKAFLKIGKQLSERS